MQSAKAGRRFYEKKLKRKKLYIFQIDMMINEQMKKYLKIEKNEQVVKSGYKDNMKDNKHINNK